MSRMPQVRAMGAMAWRLMTLMSVASPSGGGLVGRAPIGRGCFTNGGVGSYVVSMDFITGGGTSTPLGLVLDTGSANLQVVSDKCASCRNLTHAQYPGEVRGPTFTIGAAFGTTLAHATAGLRFGELEAVAVEFGAIMTVTPRFFQGAATPDDNCYDAYQGCVRLCRLCVRRRPS
jgi:hypothetical protein